MNRVSFCALLALIPFLAMPCAVEAQAWLAGSDSGLYSVRTAPAAPARPVWTGGAVRQIEPAGTGWYALTDKGLLFVAPDGRVAPRSAGLPVKILNLMENGAFAPRTVPEQLRDVEANPLVPGELVACTADSVFLGSAFGTAWVPLGAPSAVPGLKAVSFGPWPGTGEPAVWASHAYKGLFARRLAGSDREWKSFSDGIPAVHGTALEEAADLLFVPAARTGGTGGPRLYAGLSFLPMLLEWNDAARRWDVRHSDGADFGTAEALHETARSGVGFLERGGLRVAGGRTRDEEATAKLRAIGAAVPGTLACVAPADPTDRNSLSELWLLDSSGPGSSGNPATARAKAASAMRSGFYLQTSFMTDPVRRDFYFGVAASKGLDGIVIDLKDDAGRLRFVPESPELQRLGRVSDPLDIEDFTARAKARGLYLVARIVVFKDETLANAGGGRLAIRDSVTQGPWVGMRTVRRDGKDVREQIRERWVDPYSPEVWSYNVEIAREIVSRGFDEVQFDYIRFPTDGDNTGDMRFPAAGAGMSREAALESFLAYARAKIDAPISADIYGSNGWYRSGVRTGQDVEMLARFVDVIAPMFYPSHFEQGFLAQEPARLRPYRIYRTGTLRNRHIARERVLVRPYAQAFYLDVSYDRDWYDTTYVRLQQDGVRDGADSGLTWWNNSGRYDDLPAPAATAGAARPADAARPGAVSTPGSPLRGSP